MVTGIGGCVGEPFGDGILSDGLVLGLMVVG